MIKTPPDLPLNSEYDVRIARLEGSVENLAVSINSFVHSQEKRTSSLEMDIAATREEALKRRELKWPMVVSFILLFLAVGGPVSAVIGLYVSGVSGKHQAAENGLELAIQETNRRLNSYEDSNDAFQSRMYSWMEASNLQRQENTTTIKTMAVEADQVKRTRWTRSEDDLRHQSITRELAFLGEKIARETDYRMASAMKLR